MVKQTQIVGIKMSFKYTQSNNFVKSSILSTKKQHLSVMRLYISKNVQLVLKSLILLASFLQTISAQHCISYRNQSFKNCYCEYFFSINLIYHGRKPRPLGVYKGVF